MPKHNMENLGDLQKYVYLRGTITAIESADDTATVTIGDTTHTGCLIYYHCDPEAAKRDNGAIEGGSAGFAVDDEVIVMAKMNAPDAYETLWVIGHTDGVRKCGTFGKMTFNGFDFQTDNRYIFVLKIQDTDGTVGIIACDTEGKFRFPAGFSSASTLSLWYVGGRPGVYVGWQFDDLDDWLVTGGTATVNGDGTCTLPESTTLYQGVTVASRRMVINWIYIRAIIVHEVTGTLTVSTPSGNIEITAPGAYAIPVCYEVYGGSGSVNHNFICYTSAGGSAKISHPMQWFSGKPWNFANLSDVGVDQLFDGQSFVYHTPEDLSGYTGYAVDAIQYYIEQPEGGYDIANGILRYQKTTYPFQFAIQSANSVLTGDEAWTITLKRCRQLLLNTAIGGLTSAEIDFYGQAVTAKLATMSVKKIKQRRLYHSYGSGCFCANGVSWNCTEELEAWSEGSLIPYRYFGMNGQLPESWYCSGVKWIRVESGSPPTFFSDLGSADDETIGKYSSAIMVTDDNGTSPSFTEAEAHLLYDQNIFSTATEEWILAHEGEPVPIYPEQNVADFDVYAWTMIDANGGNDETPI